MQQRKLLYMGLYLLIWGEAANLRFMPECLCYIYHHVCFKIAPFLSHYFCLAFLSLEGNWKHGFRFLDFYSLSLTLSDKHLMPRNSDKLIDSGRNSAEGGMSLVMVSTCIPY